MFTRSATVWSEQAKLAPNDAAAGDNLGIAVCLDGETALVGARGCSQHAGAAYVFTRTGASWTEQAKLIASDSPPSAHLGCAVDLDGDTAIVGARDADEGGVQDAGAAYVFTRSASAWTEQAKLAASDGSILDHFGEAVSVSGDMAVIGAPGATNSGAVYVYTRTGAVWAEQAKLTGVNSSNFGSAAGATANTAVVGAPDEDSQKGAVYIVEQLYLGDIGVPCTSGFEYQSGHCADGVCCDTACDDSSCLGCTAALTGGPDGICAVVLDGSACDDGSFCNGAETCTSGVCGGSTGDPCPGPDGDDDCQESCDEASDSCTGADPDDSTCPKGVCLNGVCAGPLGTSCVDDAECERGYCVDGVCCVVQSCAPYRCGPVGDCDDTCDSASDCAPGFECTSDRQCAAPTPPAADSGCGCRTAPAPARRAGWLLLALVGSSMVARRRRHRVARRRRAIPDMTPSPGARVEEQECIGRERCGRTQLGCS